jgi:hypothetical protein
MVTILIEDIRSGVVDHQLAEVRVHLYDRQERFWADAQEVCEQLQSSPSRIDGVCGCTNVNSHISIAMLQVQREYILFVENIGSFS